MARLRDIAERVGVAVSTVSRILNNDPSLSVSSATRTKVLATAQELNYQPRRRILEKEVKRIGIFLLYNAANEIDDPYYLTIRIKVKESLLDANYLVREYFSAFQKPESYEDLDGFIIIGSYSGWSPSFNSILQQYQKPVIFIDFKPDNQYDYIVSSFEDSMRECLEYLIGKGLHRIGYIGSIHDNVNTDEYVWDERERLFQQILEKKNLLNWDYIHLQKEDNNSTNIELGAKSIHNAYDTNTLPDIFFAENDSIAIGALSALNELNLSVPENIGIVGCNDNPTSAFLNPPLSTIRIHNEYMGKIAVRILLERLNSSEITPSIGVNVPSEFVSRKSTL